MTINYNKDQFRPLWTIQNIQKRILEYNKTGVTLVVIIIDSIL